MALTDLESLCREAKEKLELLEIELDKHPPESHPDYFTIASLTQTLRKVIREAADSEIEMATSIEILRAFLLEYELLLFPPEDTISSAPPPLGDIRDRCIRNNRVYDRLWETCGAIDYIASIVRESGSDQYKTDINAGLDAEKTDEEQVNTDTTTQVNGKAEEQAESAGDDSSPLIPKGEWTDIEREILRVLYEDGCSISKIANIIQRSEETIKYVLAPKNKLRKSGTVKVVSRGRASYFYRPDAPPVE